MDAVSAQIEPVAAVNSYAVETLTPELCEEFLPLLVRHYEEIAHFKDIPLEPDFEQYLRIADSGALRVLTNRQHGMLIGYAVFLIRHNPHYKSSLQALLDVLYIHPDHRGHGHKFLAWCNEKLKEFGVDVALYHVKKAHPALGVLLTRMGFEQIDVLYGKRL